MASPLTAEEIGRTVPVLTQDLGPPALVQAKYLRGGVPKGQGNTDDRARGDAGDRVEPGSDRASEVQSRRYRCRPWPTKSVEPPLRSPMFSCNCGRLTVRTRLRHVPCRQDEKRGHRPWLSMHPGRRNHADGNRSTRRGVHRPRLSVAPPGFTSKPVSLPRASAPLDHCLNRLAARVGVAITTAQTHRTDPESRVMFGTSGVDAVIPRTAIGNQCCIPYRRVLRRERSDEQNGQRGGVPGRDLQNARSRPVNAIVQVKLVESGGRIMKQGALFVGGGSGGDPLEGVPVNGVA